MTIKELKQHIEAFPERTVFNYSLSDPFSWRGYYCEVAFSIEEVSSTREEILEKIKKALTQTFEGYKGGEFNYTPKTNVHFESSFREYTDGRYTEEMISKILGIENSSDPQERLVNLIFKK